MAASAFGTFHQQQAQCVVCIVVVLMSNAPAVVTGAVLGIRNLNFTSRGCKAAAVSVATSPDIHDKGSLIPALVVFGDSTVDAGNNNFLATPVRADFAPYGMNFEGGKPTGRFTDGLLATDFLSLKFGIPLQLPYLSPRAHGEAILTGVNFACSGAGWFEDTATQLNEKGLATQLVWYQNWKAEVLRVAGPQKGNYIIGNALYAISTGANDWLNNYYINPLLRTQYTPNQYTTMLLGLVRKYVQELYTLGGRNILILTLPPMGCIPEQITIEGHGNQGCVKSLNDVSDGFNKQLFGLLEEMEKTMARSRLILFDIYEPIYNAFQNPQKYGFKYARIGCCGTGAIEVSFMCNIVVPTCRNPNEHIFWDSFHPTSHFYSLVADKIYSNIKSIFHTSLNP